MCEIRRKAYLRCGKMHMKNPVGSIVAVLSKGSFREGAILRVV